MRGNVMGARFHNRILQTALLGTIVAYGLACLVVWREYANSLDNAKNQVHNQTRILSEHAARSFEGVDLMMDAALSRISTTQSGDPEFTTQNVKGFKTLIEAVPQIRHLVAIRKDGTDSFSNIGSSQGVRLADRKYFQVQQRSRHTGLYISNPVTGRVTGSMFIPVSRRITARADRFNGILMGVIDQKYFKDFYDRVEAGGNISSALISSNGTIFSSSPGFFLSNTNPAPKLFTDNGPFKGYASAGAAGTFFGYPFGSEEPQIVSFAKVSKTPYMVVSRMRRGDALSAWYENTISIAFSALIATAVIIWATNSVFTHISMRDLAQEELREALVDAERANNAKSEFLATMSHELRTPLNAILGFADIIGHQHLGPIEKKYQEYAGDIQTSGEHLLALINEILDLSAIEAGKQSLVKVKLSTFEIVTECCKIVEDRARANGITLVTEIIGNLPPLYADKRAVRQILLNLLSNAIKFTPEDGRVTVSVEASELNTTFRIADTGKGIPPERLPKLTDPFIRTDNDPYLAEEGWGLGLTITQSLVDPHDGTLTIDSTAGGGTTITVTLSNLAA